MLLWRFMQPGLGAGGDQPVVSCVGRVAGSSRAGHFPRPIAYRKIVAHEAEQISLGVEYVHRNDLFAETVVVRLATKMQFADGDDLMTVIAEFVMPTADRSIIGIGVIPKAGLMNIPSRCECRARRYADRRRRDRVREYGSPRGQPIEVGCFNKGRVVTAEPLFAVLVRHDNKKIGRAHVPIAELALREYYIVFIACRKIASWRHGARARARGGTRAGIER